MRYRYRNDEELKDSGVECLGKIPKDWEIKRNKYFLEEINLKSTNNNENLLSVSEYYGVALRKDKISEDEFLTRAESLDGYKICKKDDLVMNIMLAWKKAMGVSIYDGIVSPAYCVYRSKNNIFMKYYHYLFRTDLYANIFKQYSTGIIDSRLRLYPEKFLSLNSHMPLIKEQEKVANFLDEKTSQFDLIISKKERLIERLEEAKKSLISEVVTGKVKVVKTNDGYELVKRSNEEMKDSGVEWLGEIPKDWEVMKAARIANIVRGGSPRPAGDPRYFGGNEVPWITVGEVTKDDNKFLNSVSSYLTLLGKEQSRYLEKGTLVMSNSGATLGVPKILNINGCINDGSLAFLNLNINKNYFYYLLKSRTEIFRKEMQISGQPNLNTDVVKSLYILKPSEQEQSIIAQHLDNKTIEINKLIDNSKIQIEKLKEAKQSLISEAVTGKIEILD